MLEQSRTDSYDVDALEAEFVEQLSREVALPAASRMTLREAATALKARQQLSARKEATEQAASRLDEAIDRLGVSGAEAPAPIAARFVQLQARRADLDRQIAGLDQQIATQNEAVDAVLRKLE